MMFSPRNTILLAVLALTLAVPGLAQAQPNVTNLVIPFTASVISPCTGHTIMLDGYVHVLTVIVNRPKGSLLKVHVNPMGLVGTDTSTGETYRVGGAINYKENFTPGGTVVMSNLFHFTLAGSGPSSYVLHTNQHLTVNANGVVTSFFDNSWISCP